MQPRQVQEGKEAYWWITLVSILRSNTAKYPEKHIPHAAGEVDNSTEASYSSIIQLTSAAQRSHSVIQQQIQYKRNAALNPKECRQFGRKHPGARSVEAAAGQLRLNGQVALCSLRIQ